MQASPIIPEFAMYEERLEDSEIDELRKRLSMVTRTGKDRFMSFTDVVTEYIGTGEFRNRSQGFLSMCSKAAFLRGLYGYNQVIAKETDSVICNGYAAAAYCRQSLDPRWVNNLRNYVNQAWQSKDYVAFAELSGELADVLIELGYADYAKEAASESIDKVTKATSKNEDIRNQVQAALLRARIVMAQIAMQAGAREEAILRLDSAEDTAHLLDHRLCLTTIKYVRARILEESHEYNRAMNLVDAALSEYQRTGYLQGVSDAGNLKGIILLQKGQLQDARDQFEELLLIQQRLNNQIGLARTLINVGEIDRDLGQLEQTETYNQRALEISQEAEYMRGIAISKINLGDIAVRSGRHDEAIRLYEESLELTETSGMKDITKLVIFLAGDAYFINQEYDKSISEYKRAQEFARDFEYPIVEFNGLVSEIVSAWESGKTGNARMLHRIRDILGLKETWLKAGDAEPMRKVRRRIMHDSNIQSDLCILYDREKTFECRADRQSLRKECNGNLYWMAGLCPYFETFLDSLERTK
ncbi:tetratricopeptide repeat protein [Candidatus Thorarchaeota archaeon]|nr:MAG: tetratricopeptide repeat protein [Candidatus Thorarchaeota archaeon]